MKTIETGTKIEITASRHAIYASSAANATAPETTRTVTVRRVISENVFAVRDGNTVRRLTLAADGTGRMFSNNGRPAMWDVTASTIVNS